MRTLLFLLAASLAMLPVAAQEPRYSSRYTVEMAGEKPLPLLLEYEKKARKLDRNHDRVLSFKEMSVDARELPGDLRVEVDDFVRGLAHQLTGTPSAYAGAYPSAAEIELLLQEIVGAHPGLARLEALGKSEQGQPITALRVALDDGLTRPGIVVVAGQHAREWLAPQVALASVRALLENPANADLLESFTFTFVPMANPDGYEFSRHKQPMWRKNRRGTESDPYAGVDTNRNFPANFRSAEDRPESREDDKGGSDWPRSEQYRGPEAASEPETRYLQALLDQPGLVAALDLHGFGCKIIIPDEGHRVENERYKSVAHSMLKALGPDYEVVRFKALYPITGHLTGYADQRGLLSITLEMGKSFQPNPSKLRALCQQGTRGVLAFARALMAPPRSAS